MGKHYLDGEVSTDNPVNVNVKYKKERRFPLGVAMVKRTNGSVDRVHIHTFDYTKNVIVTEKD